MIPCGICVCLDLQSRTWEWELPMQVSPACSCMFFPRVGPADRSLWRGGATLSSCPGEALSAPSQALGWAVLCCVPCPGPATPVRAVWLPRGWTLPVDSRFPSSSEPNKTSRESQVSATIRSLPTVSLPPNPTGSDLWYFSERRFWPHFIFHRLLFLCMMLLFSYVSFFKRFWFIYCLSSYVLFPVFCTFLFISVPNHLKSLQKSG